MTGTQWIVDRGGNADGSGYSVFVSVEGRGTLYVIFGGPSPLGGATGMKIVEARLPSGELLRWRGSGSTGDKHDDLIIAKFDLPEPGVDYVDVTLKAAESDIVEARLVRPKA